MPSRAKKRATPSGFMMNGPMPFFGLLVGLEVRDVGAAPGRAVPRDQLARRDRTACRSGRTMRGCTARAGSPATPTPSRAFADAGRVGVVAPAHLVAGLGPRAAEDPAAARGAAVVAQLARSWPAARRPCARTLVGSFGIGEVGERLAVELHREFFRRRAVRVRIRPRQVQDRIGILAAVVLVSLAHAQEEPDMISRSLLRLARAAPRPASATAARATS